MPHGSGTVDFRDVFAAELAAINYRRDRLPKQKRGGVAATYLQPRAIAALQPERPGSDTAQVTAESDLSGLALSGGGMRSASFSLGVLQALDSLADDDKPQVLDGLDYLSTVSGGGYIGTSLVAALADKKYHDFPFTSRLDSQETLEVQHLRDYSNFIAPNGVVDLIVSVATLIRGLVVNAVTVMPFLLLLAVITILSNPNKQALGDPDVLGFPIQNLPHISITGFEAFSVTINVAVLILVLMFGSAIVMSLADRTGTLVTRERLGKALGWGLIAVGITAVFEAQPFVLAGMFGVTPTAVDVNGLNVSGGSVNDQNGAITAFFGFFGHIAPGLSAVLTPAALAVITLGQKLANVATATASGKRLTPWIAKYSSVATLVLAGAIVPLLMWTVYIYLSYWGIKDASLADGCQTRAPLLLAHVMGCAGDWGTSSIGTIGKVYLGTALLLAALCLLIGPNANTLHYLYRDRLSRAFLLDRKGLHDAEDARLTGVKPPRDKTPKQSADLQADEEPKVDKRKFSQLKPVKEGTLPEGPYDVNSFVEGAERAPYVLVNAAINIEGSEALNRRGRNADTFLFSPLFIGNRFTRYVPTRRLEKVEEEFSLASAMAISGAAASANMGRATIKVLTFSLALLNIRLGFWFPNPARIADFSSGVSKRIARIGVWQFVLEAFGWLNERALNVYLTDGGHIENLGVYELVRRRCKVIIAVDSDLDPALTFPSLVGLEMLARIDLGARIDVPWADLQAAGTAVTDAALHGADRTDYPGGCGPHAAIGMIRYDNQETGVLIHIKSMLTGDENDYILDYRRRNGAFPHETTLDQFFSEEQFEVYRALGFHAARQLFTGAEGFGYRLHNLPDDWPERVRHGLRLLNIPDTMADAMVARMKLPPTTSAPNATGSAPSPAQVPMAELAQPAPATTEA
jgi:hypothetical protein